MFWSSSAVGRPRLPVAGVCRVLGRLVGAPQIGVASLTSRACCRGRQGPCQSFVLLVEPWGETAGVASFALVSLSHFDTLLHPAKIRSGQARTARARAGRAFSSGCPSRSRTASHQQPLVAGSGLNAKIWSGLPHVVVVRIGRAFYTGCQYGWRGNASSQRQRAPSQA